MIQAFFKKIAPEGFERRQERWEESQDVRLHLKTIAHPMAISSLRVSVLP